MSAVQGELDLFAHPFPEWTYPATCPTCDEREPDGYALFRNHGHTPTRRYDPTWPCRAQRRAEP